MKRVGGYIKRQPGSMKEVQQILLSHFGGAPGASNALMNLVSQTQLNRYTQEPKKDEPPSNMPLHIIDALEALSDLPVITQWLAHRRGCLLVPLPKGKPDAYLEMLCEIGKSNGEVFKAAQHALRDGAMSVKEAAKVKRELMDLAAAAAVFISVLDGVIDQTEGHQ